MIFISPTFYKNKIKNVHENPVCPWYVLLRFRVSSHSLRIQTWRYGNERLPRNERIYVYCDLNDIDDELYLLLKCPCLNFKTNFYSKILL